MIRQISTFSFFLLLIFSESSFAQFDTTYYKKYSDMLGIGIFQATRNNPIVLEKSNVNPPGTFNEINYNINGKLITGFVLDYDKIYFALGFKTEQKNNESARKGTTDFSNYILQLGTNKFVIEGGFKKYKGFYDANTPQYIKPFTDSTSFYHNENLENKSLKIKMLYFLNHKKFSYNSSYFGSFRQLKSAASLVLGGNIFFNTTKSDTSLIPPYARNIFGNYGNLQVVSTKGFSIGGGASANLIIFKKIFINLTFTIQAEPQWRTYSFYNSEKTSPFHVSASTDLRSAIGFNSSRFFFLLTAINDLSFNNNSSLKISDNFFTSAFSIGYRFHFENKVTKWLKENKIYKMI